MCCLKTISGLLGLMRPLEWSKSLGNMLIAALVAAYTLNAGFRIWDFDWALLLTGFAGVALLWGGLYALNDYTDREHDRQHAVKKLRPVPSGMVNENVALVFAIALIAVSFAIGCFILLETGSFLYALCLAGMLINQLLYTLRPFELKKRAVLDLVSGSLVNPFFRFYAGWVLFVPAFSAPIDILAFVVLIQFGGYTLYRLGSREHEKELGYRSSVAVFHEKALKGATYLGIALAGAAYICSVFSGTLPLRFLLLAVLSALAAPLYIQAMKEPGKMDMKRMHGTIYWHYTLFIAGFVVLFAV